LSVTHIAVAALRLTARVRKYFLKESRAKVERGAAATLQRVDKEQH
jgi:hypothetical protein